MKELNSQKFNEKQEEELTSEKLDLLLDQDYPVPAFILNNLNLVVGSKNKFTENYFFKNVHLDKILTVEEYIDNWCDKHDLKHPIQLNKTLIERINIINNIVKDLKNAIKKKEDLQTIYEILLRFESEASIKFTHIPNLEK